MHFLLNQYAFRYSHKFMICRRLLLLLSLIFKIIILFYIINKSIIKYRRLLNLPLKNYHLLVDYMLNIFIFNKTNRHMNTKKRELLNKYYGIASQLFIISLYRLIFAINQLQETALENKKSSKSIYK